MALERYYSPQAARGWLERVYTALLRLDSLQPGDGADRLANWGARETVAQLLLTPKTPPTKPPHTRNIKDNKGFRGEMHIKS